MFSSSNDIIGVSSLVTGSYDEKSRQMIEQMEHLITSNDTPITIQRDNDLTQKFNDMSLSIQDKSTLTKPKSKTITPLKLLMDRGLLDDDDDDQLAPPPSAPPAPAYMPSFVQPSTSQDSPNTIDFSKQPQKDKVDEVLRSIAENQNTDIEDADDLPENTTQIDENEDEMSRIIENILSLKKSMTDSNEDVSMIPDVTYETPMRDAKRILSMLRAKNDRARYCDFLEEAILAGALAIEHIFDGNKEFFGRKIDMSGYSYTVQSKLRRIRYDTNRFVGDVMKDHSISPGWRIILELLPSLFLHNRDRKIKNVDSLNNKPRADDDGLFKDAMQKLSTIDK